jgi:hypothetical protein
MATVINDRDNLLLAAPSRVLWTGVRGIKITSDYASFTVTDGVSAFPTITFTSTLNGVNGTVNWSVLTGTATITPPATGTTATLDYVNMTSDIITVKAEVIDGGITYSDTISITKVSNGLAPKYLVITAPSQMFTRADEYTSFTPAGITLTATPYGGVAAGAYTWRYWTGSAWSSAIGGATGATLALTSSSFATETRTYQATVTIGSTVVTDEYTVVRLTGGADGFVGFLTNESVSMATDTAGTTPANIATLTAGTFKVFYGAVDVTGACTFSKVDTNCTTSITNFTGAYSASAMSADNAYSDFTATHTGIGFTMTKRLSLAKSRTGVTGTTGTSTYTATVYYRGATTPTATASTGSYNFATGVLTPPSGNVTWLTTQPATTTDNTWACDFTFTGTTASGTITAGTWSTPRVEAVNGSAGTNGEYRDVIQLYSSSSTIPTSANYNFNTNTVNTIVGGSGWSLVRPAASTSPTYMTTCLAKTTTPLVDVALTAWTAAVVVQQNGTNGSNGVNGTRTAVMDVYQWAASAPTLFPSGSSTYTWSTGQFTAPATLNGWSLTPPAAVTGQTLWIARTVYADSLTTTTTSIPWTASSSLPVGSSGVNGQRVGVLEVYQWAASAPTSYPSGTSTYTWATGAFTAPSTPNGWSVTPSAAVAGQTLWGISVSVSDNLTTATSTATWSSSTVYAVGAAGGNGTNGSNGVRTAILDMYQVAASAPATFPTGSSTYTWATGQFTAPATTNGWSLTPPASVLGQTLWIARTIYTDSGTSATSSVTWSASSAMSLGASGVNGTRTAFIEVYQWAASTPATFPSGNSTYTWSSGAFTSPTLNGWSLTPPAPVVGQTLWACSMKYADSGTSATSVITWSTTSAYAVGAAGSNGSTGATGSRASVVSLYVWGWSSPSLPTGTTTYTWSTGAWSHASETNGWQTTIPVDGGAGKTLYYIEKAVIDNTGVAATTAVTWASGATITNLSKNGVGKFTCYSKFTGNGATPSGSVDVAVGSYPTSTAFGVTWLVAFTQTPPALTTGQTLWVCDGYTNTAGTVTWLAPYLSSFKVGSLSAFTADLGTITAGNITVENSINGYIRSQGVTYGSGTGFFLGWDTSGTAGYKLYIGSSTKNLKWDGADLVLTGDVLTSGKVISTNGTGTVVVNGTTYTSSIIGVASTNNGVTGKTTSGFGVLGESASSTGVRAMSGTGSAIEASCYSESANPVISVLVSGTTSRRGIDISVGNAGQTGIRSVIPTGGSGFSAEFTGGVKLNTGSPITTGGGTGNIGSVLTSNGSSSSPSWGKKIDGGSGTADGSGNLSITFATPFSNTNYGLSGAGTSGQYFVIVSKSTAGCVVQVQDYNTAAPVPSAGISWTAIGS